MSGLQNMASIILACLMAATAAAAQPRPLAEAVPVGARAVPCAVGGARRRRYDRLAIGERRDENHAARRSRLVGRWVEPRDQTQIVLIDGSVIVADVTGFDKEHLDADWSIGGNLKLPLEWVGGIVFAPPVDRQHADFLRRGCFPPIGAARRPRKPRRPILRAAADRPRLPLPMRSPIRPPMPIG